MGNWSKPVLADTYSDFLDSLNARDLDAGTLFLTDPVNPPVGVIRYNRTTNLFQEWNGSSWVNKVISQAGGGTGAGSLPALGTMASQNANNVNITGGNISNLSSLAVNGNAAVGGSLAVTANINSSQYIQAAAQIAAGTYITASGDITTNGGRLITTGAGGHAYIRGILITGNTDLQLTNAIGKINNLTSVYFAQLQGHEITNLNGSAIDRGSVNGTFLGTGYTNTGTKVLMDNGSWVDKNLVGGGGMIEIVHSNFDFGFSVYDVSVSIPWTKGAPASIGDVHLYVNNAGYAGDASNGTMQMRDWYMVGVNTFNAGRTYVPGGSGAPNEFRVYYQAIHYKPAP